LRELKNGNRVYTSFGIFEMRDTPDRKIKGFKGEEIELTNKKTVCYHAPESMKELLNGD